MSIEKIFFIFLALFSLVKMISISKVTKVMVDQAKKQANQDKNQDR